MYKCDDDDDDDDDNNISMMYKDPEIEISILMSGISSVLTYHTLKIPFRKKALSQKLNNYISRKIFNLDQN